MPLSTQWCRRSLRRYAIVPIMSAALFVVAGPASAGPVDKVDKGATASGGKAAGPPAATGTGRRVR